MKKTLATLTALLLTIAAGAQTLNVTVGNVVYQFPASQTGEMTYTNGTTLTIMGKTFTLGNVSAMTVDNTTVTDNLVKVEYGSTEAKVYVAGNVAQYVEPTVSGAHVTIAQSNTDAVDDDEITYQLAGSTADGSLTLAGSYKCTVSLAGINLTNPGGAAINITNSKRIQISAKKGTVNTLADGTGGSQKACIYSKGQIQLQGNGTLNVTGNTKHAIKSASYISIKNLTLNITSAAGDGISCEEYFQMKSGTVSISGTADDGIQCDLGGTTPTGITEDHEDEDTGNIYIEGGTLNITADAMASKCVKSEGSISVSGGTIELNANGAIDLSDLSDPSYATGFKADGDFTQSGGTITINVTGGAGRGISADGTLTTTADNTGSLTVTNTGATYSAKSDGTNSAYHCTAKGLKGGNVTLNGGTVTVTMSGAAAKGIKADNDDNAGGNMTITGGIINVTTSGAGMYDYTESDSKGSGCLKSDNNMTISGGTLTLKSTGTGGKCIKADGTLIITGGDITATTTGGTFTANNSKAQPKAIKSNGNMTIAGGNVSATSSGHEAIETKGTLTIDDGTVYAFSSADDAINSASHMYLNGGTVTAVSNKNDAIDSNGNMTITGGTIIACGGGTPECGLDAAERYSLYIKGGTVLAIGANNNSVTSTTGSQCLVSTNATVSAGSQVQLSNGSTALASFTVPTGYSPSSGGGRGPGGGPGGGGSSGFSILVSCPGMTTGSNYSLTVGSTVKSCKASTSFSGM